MQYINAHNAAGRSSIVLGTNQFSDLAFSEWRVAWLGKLNTEERDAVGRASEHGATLTSADVPKAVRAKCCGSRKYFLVCDRRLPVLATGQLGGAKRHDTSEKSGPVRHTLVCVAIDHKTKGSWRFAAEQAAEKCVDAMQPIQREWCCARLQVRWLLGILGDRGARGDGVRRHRR